MTINNFIDCVNTSLRDIRRANNIDDEGHFVFYQSYERKLGNYYKYKLNMEYVKTKENIVPFLEITRTIQANSLEEKEKGVEELQKSILILFLTKLHESEVYDSIIRNTYGAS